MVCKLVVAFYVLIFLYFRYSESSRIPTPIELSCNEETFRIARELAAARGDDPNDIDFAIPGNDDAVRSISLYCDLIGSAILSGMEENLAEAGVDIGDADDNSEEEIPSDQEIEPIPDNDKKLIDENNNKNLNNELENNSVSN